MFREHHFKNLGRSRDHLTGCMCALGSAVDRMTGDDWIEAKALLYQLETDIGPRLATLRTASSDRFDDITRMPDFKAMQAGEIPYPDERPIPETGPSLLATGGEESGVPLNAPNVKAGQTLVALYGSVDEAMRRCHPLSREYDDLQAYRYVTTRQRPAGWIPPVATDLIED